MAKQQPWHRGPTYTITGRSGRARKVKFVTRFKIGDDEAVVFRLLRPKRK